MHFTRVLAGFAFTNTSLPKAIRFPAFVAGFFFSLIMVIPGMANFPDAFSCAGISDSRAPKTAFTSFFLIPEADSIAPKISPFGIEDRLHILLLDPRGGLDRTEDLALRHRPALRRTAHALHGLHRLHHGFEKRIRKWHGSETRQAVKN